MPRPLAPYIVLVLHLINPIDQTVLQVFLDEVKEMYKKLV